MIKSLRWRLQIWHAAILGFAIAIFGTAFYVQLQRSTYGEMDLELLSGARVLEGSLRTMPPRMRDGERPLFPPPRSFENWSGDGHGPAGGPGNRPFESRPGRPNARPDGPRLDGPRADGPRPNGPRPNGPGQDDSGGDNRPGPATPEQRLQNALQLPQLPMRGPLDTRPYFAVFNSEGELLRADPSDAIPAWTATRRAIEYRSVGRNREVLLRGPGETLILVGRDIHHHVDRLRSWLVQLVGTGLGVLGLGLIGGWWLSGKTIRPIKQISETAGKINASNLSERIEIAGMDDEVRALSTILNSMFGRLDSSFKRQSQFTADASHELRTPLAVLMSHCELALNRPRSSEEYKQTISTCQKAGARMKTLVEDLLTLARADEGKLEIERNQVDLQSIAIDATALLKPLAAERQVEITIEGCPARCQGDARRLSQVIANLLSNAIHYNKPGGKVILTTSQEGNQAVVSVRDSGCGIPSEALPHLFDRFYRVDEARSRQTGGSGLGLAICKSIIDAHEGSISVESKVEVGSVFKVQVPCSATV